jgi:hypothetical protein
MLIYSMGVSVDGFIADREGEFAWTDELRMFRNPVGWRHAVPAARHRKRPAGLDRDQDVRLARDLRAPQARPGRVGLTPPSESSAMRVGWPDTCQSGQVSAEGAFAGGCRPASRVRCQAGVGL